MNKLVADDFKVPKVLETDKFRLRMLSMDDAEKDYEAVMESMDHLKGVFGTKSKWPSKDLTIEQDKKDLGWHQKEFEIRSSFTYAVLTLDESRLLGCVYIYPSRKKSFEVDVFYWVRKSELKLDKELGKVVRTWIKEKWPFKKVAYPGRDINWKEYDSLK